MANKPQVKITPRFDSKFRLGTTVWIILTTCLVVMAVIVLSGCNGIGNKVEFTLVDGDEEVLVLLRNEEEAMYSVQYDGSKSIELEKLLVMLAPETIHVSVSEVTLLRGDEEVILEKGSTVPVGTVFTLQPGDIFDVKVKYIGRTIGGNWLYGFRIDYDDGGGSKTTDLVLDFEYAIIVK
jgi:hypothetical protein